MTVTLNTGRAVDGATEFLTAIENLIGTAQKDVFTGDAAANVLNGMNGDDSLSGMDGADRLIGGAGQDTLKGGGGADRFSFDDRDSAAGRQTADHILDFSRSGGDRIDLSGIDAKSGSTTDDTFKAIGAAAFSGAAGELRWSAVGGDTFVQGDTNGDGVADFGLVVTGDKLIAADFVL